MTGNLLTIHSPITPKPLCWKLFLFCSMPRKSSFLDPINSRYRREEHLPDLRRLKNCLVYSQKYPTGALKGRKLMKGDNPFIAEPWWSLALSAAEKAMDRPHILSSQHHDPPTPSCILLQVQLVNCSSVWEKQSQCHPGFQKGQEGGHRELWASQLQVSLWKDDGVPRSVEDLHPYGWQEDQEQSAWMH